MAVDTAFGTTVTWGTSTELNALKVMAVRVGGISREDVDTSHLGTTGYKTYQPSDLIEGGTLEIDVQYDPTVAIPHSADAETLTIAPGGQSSSAKLTGPGYINNVSMPMEYGNTGLMIQTITVKLSDDWTFQQS